MLTTEYDAIGRPTQRYATATTGTVMLDADWTYDLGGRPGTLSRMEGAAGGTTSDFQRTYSYDDLWRPYRVTTTVAAADAVQWTGTRAFTMEYGYDRNYGRMKAKRLPSITGSGETVALDYGARGHPVGETEILGSGVRGKQYRRVKSLSPTGRVTDEVLGNCVDEVALFDGSAGLAVHLAASRAGTAMAALPADLAACPAPQALPDVAHAIRQSDYAYDQFLNLQKHERVLSAGAATVDSIETYAYDDLQRLTGTARSWAGLTRAPEGESYGYDDLGNILWKGDYGSGYGYGTPARATGNAGPHAVASVAKLDGTTATFAYDANGNMTSGDGRTVDFDLMDRPVRVSMAGATTDFSYTPDGARYRQKAWLGPDTRFGPKTTYQVDKSYELVAWNDMEEERFYLGPNVVVDYRRHDAAGATRSVRYLHLDRLGSVEAVTTDGGAELSADSHGYDAWGGPRRGTGPPAAAPPRGRPAAGPPTGASPATSTSTPICSST